MAELTVDPKLLEDLEAGFDPCRPERTTAPVRVLANGKGCVILALEDVGSADLVLKRMAIFRSEAEAVHYEAVLREYIAILTRQVGVPVLPTASARIGNRTRRLWTVYIIQERMPEVTIGHNLIGQLSPAEVDRLVMAMLAELARVFDFNQAHSGELELSIDGRISNWAVVGLEPAQPVLVDPIRLFYLDIGTPLHRQKGVEQFVAEPLLRSFPFPVRPILRRVLLPDMMIRYYDCRRVTLDLLSSILNAGHGHLLRMLIDSVNWFFLAERQEMHFRPITVQEVTAYHRRDMRRWEVYLALRGREAETS
ncbi:MAG: DUF6206 family protein [Anaerolineae bacterium]